MANGTLKVSNIQTSSGSGTITLGQSGETVTIPSGATVSGAGANTPAFEATLSSGDVSLSTDTATKLNINSEIYDSDSCYDNSSNYRFLPTTAGKYYVYGSIYYQGSASDNVKNFQTQLYKNGSQLKVSYIGNPNEPFQSGCIMISCVTDMNGSSDYLELFAHTEFSTGTVSAKSRVDTFFGAYRIVGA